MKVVIASLVEGAKRAMGVVAVIDVFRAFTSAAVALANGASRIVMVRSLEEALELLLPVRVSAPLSAAPCSQTKNVVTRVGE